MGTSKATSHAMGAATSTESSGVTAALPPAVRDDGGGGSVAEPVQHVVAAGALVGRLVALLAALLALAGHDDPDLRADPAVLRLLELGARDAVRALLALGLALGALVVAAAGGAH